MATEKDLLDVLSRVGHELGEEDVKSLLFVLGDEIPLSEKERISTGIELMSTLRKKNLIGNNHFERLKTLLSGIRRTDLKVRLEEYEQKVRSINTAKANVNLVGVPNFVETEQCQEVDNLLQRNRLVILRGMSGSGKTQLTLWCAKRFRSNNTGCNVWKLSCQDQNDLIQSLSGILEFFQMKFESRQVDKNTYILEMVSVIKDRVASEEWKKQSFLFIFDDICKICSRAVSEIFSELRGTTNVKILASTESSTFYQEFRTNDDEVFVAVKGVSKEDVGKFFLTSDSFNGCEDDLNLLAKDMGYLPYALMLARSYVTATGMTVKEYSKKLRDPKFLPSVEKLLDSSGREKYNKGLVGAQILTLEKVEKQVSEVGKRLLQLMPFLDYENIPYTLLQKLANEFGFKSDFDVDIRQLIYELKSYSIGEISDRGEKTVISLHAVTKLVISHRLTEEERVLIMQTLLRFFSCHLSMDCRLRSSLENNLRLQGHAECLLIEAANRVCDPNVKDMCLLQCIIQTAIGVSFRVSGAEHVLADEYLTKARTQMFQLIGESPEIFKLRLDEKESPKTQSDDTESTEEWSTTYLLRTLRKSLSFGETTQGSSDEKDGDETSNVSKVKRLYTKLVDATKDLPLQFITDFVMKLNRSDVDIKHLQTVTGMGDSGSLDTGEQCLTSAQYEKLKSVKAAMPTEQIRTIFAVELMIIILYNNGRHYYQWKLGENESDEFCCNELLTAALLGKLLKKNFPDFVSVQYLISHRNGMFYHHETDKRFTQGKEVALAKADLKKTICYLEKISDKAIRYFEFGILKVSEFQCLHQKGMCLKLILKCHTQLCYLCKGNEEEMDQQYTEAKVRAEQLYLITKEMQSWTAVPGFHIQLARLYKLKQTKTHLEDAVNHFQIADDLETQYNAKGLSHFQLQARFGLVKCYKLLGDLESLAKAQDICHYLVTRLHATNLFDIQGKAQKHLAEVQKLNESLLSGR